MHNISTRRAARLLKASSTTNTANRLSQTTTALLAQTEDATGRSSTAGPAASTNRSAVLTRTKSKAHGVDVYLSKESVHLHQLEDLANAFAIISMLNIQPG
ncbi:hypothetical protein M409DRAFT_53964 [Zasmidium cellare ATCC 36951]|uniref:Uncharacterized protein n=1 Tax=Zasmidium cellare ATCC 36951 TaxID=1080233 RepID=A0A6A6CMB4_ZASCE|nr:uncharacterized protein M409DRAFT_53964 [Zasmidium cellare ATCC 36951]KAF2167358.1 hypothetical protein M409DRAFT_53964 [Zasmidium cellare ATCC 36951]